MEAIILAGGFGTRLRARVTDLPKSMAPVAGRPFLSLLLERLRSQGCVRVILSVGYLREKLIEAFGVKYRGMAIHYSIEESPLGTGGALRRALAWVRESSALALNGDTFLDADFGAMAAQHASQSSPITMALSMVDDTARYGAVLTEDSSVVGFAEKGASGPGWINAGAYMANRDFPWPEGLAERFSFEKDVLAPHVARLRPAVFRCRGKFLDIGIPEDLDRAQVELAPYANGGGPQRNAWFRFCAGQIES